MVDELEHASAEAAVGLTLALTLTLTSAEAAVGRLEVAVHEALLVHVGLWRYKGLGLGLG